MTWRILLFADSSQRDLLPISVLKHELSRVLPDSMVVVASFDIYEQIMRGFRPHLTVIQHLHGQRNRGIARWLHNQGGLIVALPTEGRPNSDGQLKWATEDWPFELCDLYLAWSDEVATRLPKDLNVRTVGFPRIIFYREPYKRLIPNRDDLKRQYGLNLSQPVYTIASSFPASKFVYRSVGFNELDWKDLGVTTIPGRENPTEYAKAELEYFNGFKRWLAHAIVFERGAQWILKPHPAEDVGLWRPFCEEFGIKLMLNAPIYNLLGMSDMHHARVGCTTIPEAWLCDVPADDCGDEHSMEAGPAKESSECWENTEREAYLEKWFTASIDNPIIEITRGIVELLDARKPVVIPPTTEELSNAHYALAQHDKINRFAREDGLGQFGKAVTSSMVRETIEKIRQLEL